MKRRIYRINPKWEEDTFEVSDPAQLVSRLKHCSGQRLIGFDQKGRIRARMSWSGRPFLTTNGPKGGNHRIYEGVEDMDLLTEVWLITLRWFACGGYEHLPPLVQLAVEGTGAKVDG